MIAIQTKECLVGLFYQKHGSACIILYFSWNKRENNKLTWHFRTAVLPDITYSSCTCTLYFWLTTVQPMIKSKILNHLEIIYSSEIYIHLITHNISNRSNKKSCPQSKLKLAKFSEPNCFCTDTTLFVLFPSKCKRWPIFILSELLTKRWKLFHISSMMLFSWQKTGERWPIVFFFIIELSNNGYFAQVDQLLFRQQKSITVFLCVGFLL